MKMRVWRVEDKNRHGPYTRRNAAGQKSLTPHSWELREAVFGKYAQSKQIPPDEDFDKEMLQKLDNPGIVFGFPDQKTAENWFGSTGLDILSKYGYDLRYIGNREAWLSKSGRQLIFQDHFQVFDCIICNKEMTIWRGLPTDFTNILSHEKCMGWWVDDFYQSDLYRLYKELLQGNAVELARQLAQNWYDDRKGR